VKILQKVLGGGYTFLTHTMLDFPQRQGVRFALTPWLVGDSLQISKWYTASLKLDSLGYISLAECIGVFSATFRPQKLPRSAK